MVRSTADDKYDEKVLSDIETHGWHLVAIEDGEGVPPYFFSIGMWHTLRKPEICVFGLNNTSTMAQIVNKIGGLMESGLSLKDGHASSDVLVSYNCLFRKFDRSQYQNYFGYANWFYERRDFPMLECVCWPDVAPLAQSNVHRDKL